ncbi:hypothetical protein [Phyllobacterium sp. YR531]|uniref:hypothetical protein n=1 Tax=Phyllobacterium sp. YR531 TaxID=1144343 RepID=UPI000A30F3A8|nr:hypothetical protein [Phyllobacterium sp. YR531]
MMNARVFRHVAAGLAGFFMLLPSSFPANALTMKECSAKYKAAQSAGEAEGVSWSDFRKAQCLKPKADVADSTDEQADVKPKKTASKKEPEAKPSSGTTTFPSSVAAKFAGEKPAKARMHTCLEEYRVNKAANTLGGTRWIAKGGGYYKQCNDRLKSAD